MDDGARHDRKFGSLLDAVEGGDAQSPKQTKPARVKDPAAARRRTRFAQMLGGAMALSGALVGASLAWSEFKPIRPPDVFNDPFDNVLAFALLDKDFNKLPIERRIELLKEMAERFRSLDAGDSALMAAFAAGIGGKARAQLQENLQVLAMDMTEMFAMKYAQAPADQKEEALEAALVEMFTLMQELSPVEGEQRDAAETLERIRERSQRRAENRAGDGGGAMQSAEVGRMIDWIQGDGNQNSSPGERARVTRFMRDTVRYMRGQDINKGPRRD
ncbi:MAG: hypothetical protein EA376_03670 [Phycisphaeraceae bacterium]|nr:MAG: hypothetical protein EA376_03670 [Phycisphaeraceae bacterium]